MGFAYSPQMQAILLAVSTVDTIVIAYLAVNLALMLYGETVPFRRKVAFVAIYTAVQQAYVYGLYAAGVFSLVPLPLQPFLTVPSPLFALFFYFLMVKVTGLSKYRCLHAANEIYIYSVAMDLLAKVVKQAFFAQDGPAYNYLNDMYASLVSLLICALAYFIIRAVLRKFKFVMQLAESIPVSAYGRFLALSAGGYCLVFFFAVVVPTQNRGTVTQLLCFIILMMLLALYLMMLVRAARQIERKNKDAYIYSLNKSVDELRTLKHDINNILQGYSGYIATENMEKLSQYHSTVTRVAQKTSAPANLAKRLDECPPLVSILVSKLESAEEKDVDLQFGISGDLGVGGMNELDACRCISILLDNAIEAAAESPERRVRFSYQQKSNGNRLFVIANSMEGGIAPGEEPRPGISGKKGHSGPGMKTVRKILGHYPRCTYHMTWYRTECTVYLEIAE